MPQNTTVTITYADGETREFIASDELEASINECEMFSVTTMRSDISRDEDMLVSKMYVGNPLTALGKMLMMLRNAETMDPDGDDEEKIKPVAVEILTACIKFMTDEISSHQSEMSPPVDDDSDDIYADGDHPTTVEGSIK